MASRAFFDPIKLLRLAPLLTSTATLMYAYDQHLFFSTWLHDSYRHEANNLLPRWFNICLKRALRVIVTLYPLSITFAVANIYTGMQKESSNASLWYWSGMAFTVGHFLFGKKAIRLLDAIETDQSKGNSTTDMREWLGMNLVRSLAVDLPAWLSFLMAAMESFQL
ncbi:hypothetical protein MMC28_003945 [Mycoblastus sanguinarius]|nr:hypothetical protein [Mycoblastus sanguinarius]